MPYDSQDRWYIDDVGAFVNTSLFMESGKHFLKHGCYTFAPKGTLEHKEFWDIEEDRLLNGMTAPGRLVNGKIEEVHITGTHYGFLNYAFMKRSKVTQYEKDEMIAVYQSKNSGKVKSGRKFLGLPDFWDGHYKYFKTVEECLRVGKHLALAKARRKGFSYIEGFAGALDLIMNPHSVILYTADELKYLLNTGALFEMTLRYIDHFEEHTDFGRGYLKRRPSDGIIQLGYYPEGTTIPKGYLSSLQCLAFGENAEVAVGKDAFRIKVEEAGKAPNLADFLTHTLPTMKDGDLTTGMMTMWGTGGTKDAYWEPFENVYYNPRKYGFLECKNIWEDSTTDDEKIGYFFPHRQNLIPYTDKHGNSVYEIIDAEIEKTREEQKKNAKTAKDLRDFIAQWANKPSEAFSNTSSGLLPDVSDQIHRVKHEEDIALIAKDGTLSPIGNSLVKFEFIQNKELPKEHRHEFISSYPLRDNDDVFGALRFWQMPYKNNLGVVPTGLYKIWFDPFGIEKNDTATTLKNSLASAYIYEVSNNFTPTRGDIIIGAFHARRDDLDSINEMIWRLSCFCNAIVQFENDQDGGLKSYFRRKPDGLDRLADEPNFNWEKEMGGQGGRLKGVSMNHPTRKSRTAVIFRRWLLIPRGRDEFGNVRYNYHYIFDLGLLKEINAWVQDRNFDRVSACLVGQIYIEEDFDVEVQEIKTSNALMSSQKGGFNKLINAL